MGGDDLAAVANLFVHGDVATLSGAATLPEFRRRGAQSALMAARIREGAARGCTWLSTETWPESPGNPNPSQHNMRQLGLTELYVRQNWVFKPGQDSLSSRSVARSRAACRSSGLS